MAAKDKVWLVTGASRGIGKAIARNVLKKGGRVIGTVRNMMDVQDLMAEFAGNFRAVSMEMNEEASIGNGFEQAVDAFGQIDVLVNNAGYGLHGMVEEVSMEQVRAQMETNFFGLVSLTQKALPGMRERGFGWVANVASIAGLKGTPSLGIYNASKFAVVGLTEALAEEVAEFGVKVSIVEPGPYRTDWAGASMKQSDALGNALANSAYKEKNGQWKAFFEERNGQQPGDPEQIAKVLWAALEHEVFPVHMLFGDVAINLWNAKLDRLKDPAFIRYYPHDKETV